MAKSEKEQVLDIISKAILRETFSYNYYFKAGQDETMPDGVRGLLSQLAQEERGHRKLLIREYTAVQKGWSSRSEDEPGNPISYSIPPKPDEIPVEKMDRIDFSAVSLPAKLVGGDNLLVRPVRDVKGSETGLFVVLYDAMGHGIETTRVNAFAADILGDLLNVPVSADAEKQVLSPARVVTELNGGFSREFQGQGVFITLFAIYIDLSDSTITYTTAGHEPPMIHRSDGRIDMLFNTQLIVGIDSDKQYSEQSVAFGRGEKLFFFTDGILEAEDHENEHFGRKRLAESLARHASGSSRKTVRGILKDLSSFIGDRPMNDELTRAVLGVGPNQG